MKVLVADPFEPSGLEGLRAAGCEVVFEPGLGGDALAAALAETAAEVLVVRSTKVTGAMLDAGRLALVVRAGAGYDTIDVAAASARGIYVSNCPGRNAIAVAELAFGLILALDRRIPDNVVALRAGRWDKKEFAKARGLHGRTLGLLGFGTIAQEVARRAQAFGLHLVIWSRRFADAPDVDLGGHGLDTSGRRTRVEIAPTPGDVAAAADILSIHLALAEGTRGLVDAELLGAAPARGDRGQHRPGRGRRPRRAGRSRPRARPARRARRLPRRADHADRRVRPAPAPRAGGLRDPPHRGLDRAGPGGDRRRDRPDRALVRRDRAGPERREPRPADPGDASPGRPPPQPAGRPRPRLRAPARRAGLNVLETENVIFEDAEAAVARINLDGAVPDEARSGRSRRATTTSSASSSWSSEARSGDPDLGVQPDAGRYSTTVPWW